MKAGICILALSLSQFVGLQMVENQFKSTYFFGIWSWLICESWCQATMISEGINKTGLQALTTTLLGERGGVIQTGEANEF